MADTDILLTVDLDTQDAEKTAEQLQREVENIFKSRSGNQSAAITNIEKQMKQVYQKAIDLRAKMEDLSKIRVVSPEYQELENQLNAIESAAAKLTHKMRAFEEAGKDTTSDKYQNWERQIEQLGNRAAETVDKLEKMKAEGTDTIAGPDTTQYQKYQEELDVTNDKLKQLIIRHSEASSVGGAAISKLSIAAQGLKAAFIKVVGGIKKLISSLKNLRKSSGGVNNSMKSMLRNILRFGLGIGSIYMLINKLRSAVKEGFTNLYKDDKKFKDSVDSLKGSLTTLKNAFASAFQPIVSMAIPYIQRLVDWLTQLMDQIARFTVAALGQKTYMKAIKQTGQAAEKASRQLSKLDNLNVLTSDSGAGQGKMFEEVPIDEEKIDLLEKLKEIVAQMESVGAKVGTAIRDALNSVDWDNIGQYTNLIAEGIGNFINGLVRVEGLGKSIGTTFGEILNTIMQFKQTLLDTIDFEAVGKFIGDIAQSFVDAFDWEGRGELWATELNSLFETLKGFTEELNGLSLGTSLGDMINSFTSGIDWNTINESFAGWAEDISDTLNGLFTEVNWTDVAATLSQGISNILDFAINFVTNLDGEAIADAIIGFLAGIDWIRIATELGTLLLSMVEKAVELLWGLAAGIFDNLADLFDEMGWDSVAGFFRGMADNLRESIQMLKDWFNQYIVNPVKEFFGIHSPSTLFANFGKMIIQGLVNGIKNALALVGTVLSLLKTKFLEKFQEIKTGVINIVKALWDGIKAPINSIIGGFEFLVNCVIKAINKMIDAMNGLSFDVPDWVPEIGGSTFGFSIPNLREVTIPRLAQGAVIPPNKQFMAMLGDQKSGTNIEAPLDTIKQALLEVMNEDRGNNTQEIILNLDGREFMRAIVKQNNEYKKSHGGLSALG